MEAQISGMTIRTVQKQILRNTDALNIPIGAKPNEKIRGEIWLQLWDEAEIPKFKRFLHSSSRYRFTENVRYLRTGIPCTIIAYFENTKTAIRATHQFAPGIIFSLLQSYAPGTLMVRWIKERPVNLSNVEEVERMFAAMNRRRRQEGNPGEH